MRQHGKKSTKFKRPLTLITGAGSGIGLGIAQKFYQKDHRLILVIHKENQKKFFLKNFEKDRYKILVGDLSKLNFIKKVGQSVNYVNNIINNAGVANKEFFIDVNEKDLNYLMNVNFKSTFLLSQIFAKKMLKKKIKGNIISISSQLGHTGAYNRSLYCASKFAMEGFTKSAAMDLGKYGINVNTVAPTKVIVNNYEEKTQKKRLNFIKNKIPSKKFSKINEIADVVYFLTTDSAKNITGTSIRVDGGWTAGK